MEQDRVLLEPQWHESHSIPFLGPPPPTHTAQDMEAILLIVAFLSTSVLLLGLFWSLSGTV